jgi:predicted nucleic acid-binding protein
VRSSPGSRGSAPATGWIARSCTTGRFADTNVLLYAVSPEAAEREKAERANEILADPELALSVQVLQEFYVQATRASRPDPLSHDQAASLVESFLRFTVADVTREVLVAALATRQRFQIFYWDAAILEAARSLGCDIVLSEDLGDGQDYGGVVVENPFTL